jgi:hypothetical protein
MVKKQNKKSINYYDTPLQRRQYGNLYVDIVSALTGVIDSYKNDISGADIDVYVIVNNKQNYGENNLDNQNNK